MATPFVVETAAVLNDLTRRITEVTNTIRGEPDLIASIDSDRRHLTDAAQALLDVARPPAEQFTDMMSYMAHFTALRLFIQWKVLDMLPDQGSVSIKDLATKLGADESLITRLSRTLVVFGFLKQEAQGLLAHSRGSKLFSSVSPLSALVCMGFDDHLRSISSMLKYFDTFGLREPSSRYQTIYAFAAGDPDLTVWEHMNRDPARMKNFMTSMVVMGQKLPIVGSYDFSWVLAEASRADQRTLIVDVDGGKGHALQAICEATPGLPIHRCAVEDLDVVIDEARNMAQDELSRAQFVSMDFHKEQPIKGAFIYYIRRCLHDYGDEDAITILSQIRNAMAMDSRLLIVEQILGETPSKLAVATDFYMATLGGKERTLGGFKYLTSRAGLTIQQVYPSEGSDTAVIECTKA